MLINKNLFPVTERRDLFSLQVLGNFKSSEKMRKTQGHIWKLPLQLRHERGDKSFTAFRFRLSHNVFILLSNI